MSEEKNELLKNIPEKERPGVATLLIIIGAVLIFGLGVAVGSYFPK